MKTEQDQILLIAPYNYLAWVVHLLFSAPVLRLLEFHSEQSDLFSPPAIIYSHVIVPVIFLDRLSMGKKVQILPSIHSLQWKLHIPQVHIILGS